MYFNDQATDQRFYNSAELQVLLDGELGVESWREWMHSSHRQPQLPPCNHARCSQYGNCRLSTVWFGCTDCFRLNLRCSHHNNFMMMLLAEAFPSYSMERLTMIQGEYYGYHAHARTKVSRPLGAIKGLQKGELKVAVGGKGNVNGQRAKSAIDDLQRYTFELAVGRGELQRRVLSLEAMIEDMASIIYGVRVSKKESAETGMERLERMMEARRGDVWMDMPETCYGDFSV